jgi:hypothetical protein
MKKILLLFSLVPIISFASENCKIYISEYDNAS